MELYYKNSHCWAPYTRKFAYVDFQKNTAPTKWITRHGVIPFLKTRPIYSYRIGISATHAKEYFCGEVVDRLYMFNVSYKNEKKTFYVTRHFLYNDKYELICVLLRNRYMNDIVGDTFMLLIRDDSYNTKPVQAIMSEFKKYFNVDVCITNRIRMHSIIDELISVPISKIEDAFGAVLERYNGWFDINRREEIKGWLQEIQTEEKDTEQNNSMQELSENLDSLNVPQADSEADSTTTQR